VRQRSGQGVQCVLELTDWKGRQPMAPDYTTSTLQLALDVLSYACPPLECTNDHISEALRIFNNLKPHLHMTTLNDMLSLRRLGLDSSLSIDPAGQKYPQDRQHVEILPREYCRIFTNQKYDRLTACLDPVQPIVEWSRTHSKKSFRD
jgi:hypothetical protein